MSTTHQAVVAWGVRATLAPGLHIDVLLDFRGLRDKVKITSEAAWWIGTDWY